MNSDEKGNDDGLIACEICLKEVPKSEANVVEAQEYVHHFCGANCYQQWHEEASKHSDTKE